MTEDRVVFTMTNYVTVGSLEEAYALLGKNKSNKIYYDSFERNV